MANKLANLDKVVNPDLARAALHGVTPYGAFKAYVRFAVPEKSPIYLGASELIRLASLMCAFLARILAMLRRIRMSSALRYASI